MLYVPLCSAGDCWDETTTTCQLVFCGCQQEGVDPEIRRVGPHTRRPAPSSPSLLMKGSEILFSKKIYERKLFSKELIVYSLEVNLCGLGPPIWYVISVCQVMLYGHIFMLLQFFGHPRLSGSLQAVRHDIF